MRRDLEVGALVAFESPWGTVAMPPEALAEALERAKAVVPVVGPATAATAAPEALVDADRLGELTGIPGSWFADQARQQQIPHLKFGRYIRFRPSEVLGCPRFRERTR